MMNNSKERQMSMIEKEDTLVKVYEDLSLVTNRRFADWKSRINSIKHPASKVEGDIAINPDHAIAIWYILSKLFLRSLMKESLPFETQEFFDSFEHEGLYKSETIRKYCYDLEKKGAVYFSRMLGKRQIMITDNAAKAVKETLDNWLESFRDIQERYEALKNINDEGCEPTKS